MSEKPGGGATSDRAATRLDACANTVCNSGSYAEPGQFVAVPAPTAPTGPFRLPRIGGVKGDGPTRYRNSNSDDERAGNTTCAGRSSGQQPQDSRQRDCFPAGVRRNNRMSAFRPGDKPDRDLRRL